MKKKGNSENKFFAFLKKHFSKETRKCPHCGETVDAYVKNCPRCYARRKEDILPTRFQNMTFLTDYKEILLFAVGFLGFILISLLISQGVAFFPIDDELKSVLSNLIGIAITLAIIICVLNYDFKEYFYPFKKSFFHLRPIIVALIALAIIIAFSYGYSGILNVCGCHIGDNDNQNALVAMTRAYPALAFFYVVILAPVLEEITYRVGLFSILRKYNRYLAYVVEVIFFTIVHFNFFSTNLPNECLNLPLYIVPAFILTIQYEYEGTASSTYTHILNNLISFIIILAVR